MLRSILIGLDGSEDGGSARELALRWARQWDALLIGVTVVDEPGILSSGPALFEEGWHRSAAAPLVVEAR